MTVKLLTKQHLEFLGLKGGCTGSSESIYVKKPHCWKSHVTAQYNFCKVISKHIALYTLPGSVLWDKYIFFGQVHNAHLVLTGQVSNLAISTLLIKNNSDMRKYMRFWQARYSKIHRFRLTKFLRVKL